MDVNRDQIEAELAAIVRSSQDAIIGKDLNGVIRSWNPAAERVFGYSASEIVGHSITTIIPPEYQDEERRILDMVRNGTPVEPFETVRIRKNGERFDALLLVSPVKDRLGTITGASKILRDISQSKGEREHARTTLERLEKIYHSNAVGIFYWNFDGRIIDANEKFLEIVGFTQTDLKAGTLDWRKLTPPEYLTLDEDMSRNIRAHRTINPYEKEFFRKDGNRIYVTVSASLLDRAGVEGVAFVVDITERKLADETVQAIRGAAIGTWHWDVSRGEVRWSEKAREIFGFTAHEPLSYPLFIERVHPLDRGPLEEAMRETVTARGVIQLEHRVILPSGEVRWVAVRGASYHNNIGDAHRMEGIIMDVTARRRAEEEVRVLNVSLAAQTEKLEQAYKELEAFSYSVSHDLRAPLRHINGYIELINKYSPPSELTDKTKHYLETVTSTVAQMGNLIDDLLAFSRTAREPLKTSAINMQELVEDAIRICLKTEPDRDIHWNVGDLPQVSGDLSLLRQVWVNLVSNALKYSRTRTPAKIEIGGHTSENQEHCFYVKDNGVGFDNRYSDKLFGVFQRLHDNEHYEGNGIGLANVKRIVSRHRGRVWADSKLNEGATFYFSLPSD